MEIRVSPSSVQFAALFFVARTEAFITGGVLQQAQFLWRLVSSKGRQVEKDYRREREREREKEKEKEKVTTKQALSAQLLLVRSRE